MATSRYPCTVKELVASRQIARVTTATIPRSGSIASTLADQFTAAVTRVLTPCGAFEWFSLSYLAFSGALMLAFHQNLPHPVRDIAIHFSVFAAILLIINLAASLQSHRPASSLTVRVTKWIRNWYPQAIFLFCFEELRILVHLIVPNWQDSFLISFDHWITGVYPTVWLARFNSYWTNEAMQIAYMSYFLFLTILATSLYRRRNLDPASVSGSSPAGPDAMRAFWTVMTASIVAYSIGYTISIFFPIEAPYFAMRSYHLPVLTGGAATGLINFIESWGRVRGGAFPSAHVSGSFVALLGAWRYRRYLFWIFLPFFIGMCVSTIYGHYHYIADVIAGIIVGGVGFSIALRVMDLPRADPASRQIAQN